MAIRIYQRANATAEFDPEALADYLRGLGYLIGPGGYATGFDVIAGVPTATVTVDVDPRIPDPVFVADLDAFAPANDPGRVARAYLINRAKTIRAKAPADRTVAERDLLALLALLRPDV